MIKVKNKYRYAALKRKHRNRKGHWVKNKSNHLSRITVKPHSKVSLGMHFFDEAKIREFIRCNSSFRKTIVSGNYFYYNNRIWLYHSDMFDISEGTIKVNDTADNVKRFALKYTKDIDISQYDCVHIEKKHNPVDGNIHIRINCNPKHIDKLLYSCLFLTPSEKYKNKEYLLTLEFLLNFIKKGGGGNFPNNFQDYFSKMMDEKGFSALELFEATGISVKTIGRMRSETGYIPSLEYIIICCVVMKLPPWHSDALLSYARIHLRKEVELDRVYIAIIHVLYPTGSIELCDCLLEMFNYPTLSSFVIKNQKNK